MNPYIIGVLQALGLALILTVLSFFADSSNLSGLVNPTMATLIAAVCLAIEQNIQTKSGRALFGMVKTA